MYIIKESEIVYDSFVEAVQSYVADNYNNSTIKTIVSYLKSGHQNDFKPVARSTKLYRGIYYPNIKENNFENKISRIESKDISTTQDFDEAAAFAFGSNIYEFSNIKQELKKMSKNDYACIYECITLPSKEIMIDVLYCLKNNLLSEVSFIEENEVMLYPNLHTYKAVEIYHGGVKIL